MSDIINSDNLDKAERLALLGQITLHLIVNAALSDFLDGPVTINGRLIINDAGEFVSVVSLVERPKVQDERERSGLPA